MDVRYGLDLRANSACFDGFRGKLIPVRVDVIVSVMDSKVLSRIGGAVVLRRAWLYHYIASDCVFCIFRDVSEFGFARFLELCFGLREHFGVEPRVGPFFPDGVVVQVNGIKNGVLVCFACDYIGIAIIEIKCGSVF